jgi:hypothetical protein
MVLYARVEQPYRKGKKLFAFLQAQGSGIKHRLIEPSANKDKYQAWEPQSDFSS